VLNEANYRGLCRRRTQ